jgi:uncharacterized protein (DUF362 family)
VAIANCPPDGSPEDTKEATRRAIMMAGGFFQAVVPRGAQAGARRAFIKPNLTVPAPPGSAICTDIGVVVAVIELLREAGIKDIVVGDGSGDDPEGMTFITSGYDVAMERLGVRLVNLNDEPARSVPVPGGLAYQTLDIPEIVLASDVVIDVAKMKTHNEALVTLGAKNLVGVPPVSHYNLGLVARQDFHAKAIHKVIHDIHRVVPVTYTVIDGILAMEGEGPLRGEPVPMGVVLAGANVVAVDVVACHLMQIAPQEVDHLVYLSRAGLGPLDIGDIEIVGASLEAASRPFQKPARFVPTPGVE